MSYHFRVCCGGTCLLSYQSLMTMIYSWRHIQYAICTHIVALETGKLPPLYNSFKNQSKDETGLSLNISTHRFAETHKVIIILFIYIRWVRNELLKISFGNISWWCSLSCFVSKLLHSSEICRLLPLMTYISTFTADNLTVASKAHVVPLSHHLTKL